MEVSPRLGKIALHRICVDVPVSGIAGIPLIVVQSIVDHMTPEMTRHYMEHTTLKDKREWMNVMQTIRGVPQIAQNASPKLLEEDTERTELLQKLEALPTEKLRRLMELIEKEDHEEEFGDLPLF